MQRASRDGCPQPGNRGSKAKAEGWTGIKMSKQRDLTHQSRAAGPSQAALPSVASTKPLVENFGELDSYIIPKTLASNADTGNARE